jgi:dolichol kinase
VNLNMSSDRTTQDRPALDRPSPELARPPGITSRELRRQLVHASLGAVALSLRWLTVTQALVLAGVAVVHNLLVLPRVPWGRALFREDEARFGGIVLYPMVVLALLLALPLHLAAAAWMVLAVGDGASNVCGRTLGVRRLPWNPRKSWAGTLGFWLCATPAAAGALLFVAANPAVAAPIDASSAWLMACSASLAGAAVESLPIRVDDNLTVGFASGATLALWTALS